MTKRTWALLAAFTATFIYGAAYSIAKDVMPLYLKPYGFILIRVMGAAILFWILDLFLPKENVEISDYPKIFFTAIFGIAINMLTFYKGLSLTTPINSAVIMITVPILVLIFSSILLKEKLSIKKGIGIILGLLGAMILTVYGKSDPKIGTNVPWGNFLTLINAISYAFYLVIVKNLLAKYSTFTFIKWFYLFGMILVFPFGISELLDVQWLVLPRFIVGEIVFIIVCSTFMTYLFNLLALSQLKASTMSVFIYLQPVIASFFAILMKTDHIDSIKLLASGLIFLGVYLATTKKWTK